MKKVIYDIDEFNQTCGYFDPDNKPNGHAFGCTHPKADDKQCLASACPLASLAEYLDFKECGYSDEEAFDYGESANSVFVYE